MLEKKAKRTKDYCIKKSEAYQAGDINGKTQHAQPTPVMQQGWYQMPVRNKI